MTLTAEQSELWTKAWPDGPQPTGDQTPEQATEFSIDNFIRACEFAPLEPVPSPADVKEHMEGNGADEKAETSEETTD